MAQGTREALEKIVRRLPRDEQHFLQKKLKFFQKEANEGGKCGWTETTRTNNIREVLALASNQGSATYYVTASLPNKALRDRPHALKDEIACFMREQSPQWKARTKSFFKKFPHLWPKHRCALLEPPSHLAPEHSAYPIERLPRISDVLARCGFGHANEIGVDMACLDEIPNLRSCSPSSSTFAPWSVTRIEETFMLPSYSNTIRILRETTLSHSAYPKGDVWKGKQRKDEFDLVAWRSLLKRLEERTESEHRILNLQCSRIVGITSTRAFKKWGGMFMRRTYGVSERAALRMVAPDMIITPRGAMTEIHHDVLPGFTVAISDKDPCKLWIFFDSRQIHHLPKCDNSLRQALHHMSNVRFLVQMAGEVVMVPPNSPHAVFSLNDCYLYGTHIAPDIVYDPPSPLADVDVEGTSLQAWHKFVRVLAKGIRNPGSRERYLEQFFYAWPNFPEDDDSNQALRTKIVRLLKADLANTNECAWCKRTGHTFRGRSELEHIEKHVYGSSSHKSKAGVVSAQEIPPGSAGTQDRTSLKRKR